METIVGDGTRQVGHNSSAGYAMLMSQDETNSAVVHIASVSSTELVGDIMGVSAPNADKTRKLTLGLQTRGAQTDGVPPRHGASLLAAVVKIGHLGLDTLMLAVGSVGLQTVILPLVLRAVEKGRRR